MTVGGGGAKALRLSSTRAAHGEYIWWQIYKYWITFRRHYEYYIGHVIHRTMLVICFGITPTTSIIMIQSGVQNVSIYRAQSVGYYRYISLDISLLYSVLIYILFVYICYMMCRAGQGSWRATHHCWIPLMCKVVDAHGAFSIEYKTPSSTAAHALSYPI